MFYFLAILCKYLQHTYSSDKISCQHLCSGLPNLISIFCGNLWSMDIASFGMQICFLVIYFPINLNHPTNLLLKESKKHLGQLASLGALGALVDDIASENQQEPTPGASHYDYGKYENLF